MFTFKSYRRGSVTVQFAGTRSLRRFTLVLDVRGNFALACEDGIVHVLNLKRIYTSGRPVPRFMRIISGVPL